MGNFFQNIGRAKNWVTKFYTRVKFKQTSKYTNKRIIFKNVNAVTDIFNLLTLSAYDIPKGRKT